MGLRENGTWLAEGDTAAWRAASPVRRTMACWFWDPGQAG